MSIKWGLLLSIYLARITTADERERERVRERERERVTERWSDR